MIILGIDPGYALLGYGIIEKIGNTIKVLDYGVIETTKKDTIPVRLKIIYDGVKYLIEKYKPQAIAMEELFFQHNQTTVINVAQARGVISLASVEGCSKLYEYTPMQIKQALTGYGKAEKKQVQYMVKAILNLKEIPKPDDAADALAVAITHAQSNQLLGNFDIK